MSSTVTGGALDWSTERPLGSRATMGFGGAAPERAQSCQFPQHLDVGDAVFDELAPCRFEAVGRVEGLLLGLRVEDDACRARGDGEFDAATHQCAAEAATARFIPRADASDA